MANKKSGLGKGLGQLFLENSVDELVANNTLPLEEIVPNKEQPRKTFDETALEELAESIRQHGVLQPLLVRPLPGGVDEVLVIRGVLIVQADEADLHSRLVLLVILGLVAAGAQCEHHDEREQHRYELFHSQLSLKYCLYLSALLAQRRYPSAAKNAHWQAQPVTALLPMRNREAARGRLPRNISHR